MLVANYLGHNPFDRGADWYFEFGPNQDGSITSRVAAKITIVGETLFRLRDSKGFAEFCRRLRHRNFATAFSEAFCARVMLDGGFAVNAKPEVHRRGEDFDFTAEADGTLVSVEVTRLQPKPFANNTLKNALDKKRKQIARDIPAVIFCVCPEQWFDNETAIIGPLYEITREFFRTSQRANAVFYVGERHTVDTEDETFGIVEFPFLPIFNANPRHPTEAIANVVPAIALPSLMQTVGGKAVGLRSVSATHSENNPFCNWVNSVIGPRKG